MDRQVKRRSTPSPSWFERLPPDIVIYIYSLARAEFYQRLPQSIWDHHCSKYDGEVRLIRYRNFNNFEKGMTTLWSNLMNTLRHIKTYSDKNLAKYYINMILNTLCYNWHFGKNLLHCERFYGMIISISVLYREDPCMIRLVDNMRKISNLLNAVRLMIEHNVALGFLHYE